MFIRESGSEAVAFFANQKKQPGVDALLTQLLGGGVAYIFWRSPSTGSFSARQFARESSRYRKSPTSDSLPVIDSMSTSCRVNATTSMAERITDAPGSVIWIPCRRATLILNRFFLTVLPEGWRHCSTQARQMRRMPR